MLLACCLSIGSGGSVRAADAAGAKDYGPVTEQLEKIVAEELARKIVPGVSIALVDDQQIVYSRGFGMADRTRGISATPQTIYRAGSISKLFNAVAAMQMVEQGKLDLDKPATDYDPDFHIVVPFDDAPPITPRMLMCHRSGMIRESPVGGYFDDSQPGIAASVASVGRCALVNLPNTKTRYSNIGPTIVGRIVERLSGQAYEDYQREHVLGPLGMTSSAWTMNDSLHPRLAKGAMRIAEPGGTFHEIDAPEFELGTIPAGNLYTTAEDLARFLTCLFAQGQAGGRQVVKPETLSEMFKPQLISDPTGFGLGFFVGKFKEHRTVQHMGAVYGFTTMVMAIPEHKLGVVVLTNADIAVGPVQKLTQSAMELMLEARLGEQPPAVPAPFKPSREELAALTGEFESQSYWARVSVVDDQLRAEISGQTIELTPTDALNFKGNGRFVYQGPVVFERDADGKVSQFTALNQKFRRIDPRKTPTAPDDWQKFIGSYGPTFIPLIISIRHGHLYAMTENEMDYRLTPLNRTVFETPPGLYDDEQIVFQVGADGQVHSAILANMVLPRAKP